MGLGLFKQKGQKRETTRYRKRGVRRVNVKNEGRANVKNEEEGGENDGRKDKERVEVSKK